MRVLARHQLARRPSESFYPGLWRGLRHAYLPAAGTSGNVLRDSVRSLHGALTNFSGTFQRPNRGGNSLRFDGTDDHALFTNGSFDWMHTGVFTNLYEPLQWTVAWWASEEGAADATKRTVLDNSGDVSTSAGVCIQKRDSARALEVAIFRSASSTTVCNPFITPFWPDTGLHLAVFTYDQSLSSANFSAYIDGQLKGTANKTGLAPTTNTATYQPRMGYGATNTNPWQGSVGAAIIWSRALPRREVATLGSNPMVMFQRRTHRNARAPQSGGPWPHHLRRATHGGMVTMAGGL